MGKEYFCIFAGGGVRGTAYLGVLNALQEMDIKMTGLAGSSVGAVFASLYSVGYTFDEMREILFNLNYETFRDLNFPFKKNFGICKGDNFYNWIKAIIEKKYYGKRYRNGHNRPVTFRNLDKDLIIMATNLSETCFMEYSKFNTPDIEVAKAVRASISIPGFFKPVWEKDNCLVDGDIIKNFPLWIFTQGLLHNNSRILEFRLEGSQTQKKIDSPFDYFNALLDTSYNISTDIMLEQYGNNDQFDFIRIDTENVRVIDFAMSNDQKEKLIKIGYDSTKKYFTDDILKKKRLLLHIYETLSDYIKALYQEISGNKIKESRITMSNMVLFLTENKESVHQTSFDKIIMFKKKYFDNIFLTRFLKRELLKDKSNMLLQLERIIEDLNDRTEEIKKYLEK